MRAKLNPAKIESEMVVLLASLWPWLFACRLLFPWLFLRFFFPNIVAILFIMVFIIFASSQVIKQAIELIFLELFGRFFHHCGLFIIFIDLSALGFLLCPLVLLGPAFLHFSFLLWIVCLSTFTISSTWPLLWRASYVTACQKLSCAWDQGNTLLDAGKVLSFKKHMQTTHKPWELSKFLALT